MGKCIFDGKLKCKLMLITAGTCLGTQSVPRLLCLVHGDRNSAVRVQHHLSTAEYGHQQEEAEQEEEEHCKAKVHIHVEPALGDAGRVHIAQNLSSLKQISSALCPHFAPASPEAYFLNPAAPSCHWTPLPFSSTPAAALPMIRWTGGHSGSAPASSINS